LLDVATVLSADKTTVAVAGTHVATSEPVTGYEIHLGQTTGSDTARPLLDIAGRADGAQSADGLIAGTYVHGIFAADGFRGAFLAALGGPASDLRYEAGVEATLEALAGHLEQHVDIDALLAIAGYRQKTIAAATATTAKNKAFAPR
jgi:adenosylcobyric acid synthase